MTALGLVALLAAGCASGVQVRAVPDGTFDVEARAAPLSALLECLADRAGFRIVNEAGASLRQPVTAALRGQTSVQVVYRILEGLGVNYAFATDASGSKIQVLVLSAVSASSTTPAPSNAPAASTAPGAPRPDGRPPGVIPVLDPPSDVGPAEEPDAERRPPEQSPEPTPPLAPVTPLYPEALPLSPLSLREARRILPADAPPAVSRDAKASGSGR